MGMDGSLSKCYWTAISISYIVITVTAIGIAFFCRTLSSASPFRAQNMAIRFLTWKQVPYNKELSNCDRI